MGHAVIKTHTHTHTHIQKWNQEIRLYQYQWIIAQYNTRIATAWKKLLPGHYCFWQRCDQSDFTHTPHQTAISTLSLCFTITFSFPYLSSIWSSANLSYCSNILMMFFLSRVDFYCVKLQSLQWWTINVKHFYITIYSKQVGWGTEK